MNFVHQQENFAISIGIYIDGKPYAGFVYDVMADVLYHAKVGEGAFRGKPAIRTITQFKSKTKHYWDQLNWLTKPVLGEILKKLLMILEVQGHMVVQRLKLFQLLQVI